MVTIIILGLILFGVYGIFYLKEKYTSKPRQVFRYVGTGNLYCKVMDCKVKINGVWKDGIIYCDLKSRIYVREKSNFDLRFARVK